MFKKSFHLLRGHSDRKRQLRKLGKPDSTLSDAYSLIKAFSFRRETVLFTFSYSTTMFKRMNLTGSIPIKDFKAKDLKIAVYGPEELIKNTDADIKVTTADKIEDLPCTHLVCHPSVFKSLIPLGRVLGPKNLMPSVKKGTVTEDLQNALNQLRQSTTITDNKGCVDGIIGTTSMSLATLQDNIKAIIHFVNTTSNTTLDQGFIKNVFIRSSYSPAIPISRVELKKFV